MADIVTSTLKIGSNNLVLRDADAQEQITDLKGEVDSAYNNDYLEFDYLKGVTYVSRSNTTSGITWTLNADGSVTANGTATGNINFYLIYNKTFSDNVTLHFSGCPEGGASDKYACRIGLYTPTGSGTSNWGTVAYDYGNGVDYRVDKTRKYVFMCSVFKNATVNNITFHPSLTKTYNKSNYEIGNKVFNSHVFSFIKSEGASNVYGDCTIITGGDVNGLIDLGRSSSVTNLKSKLSDLKVYSIDFVILSHYHGDHIGGSFATALDNLIAAGIDFTNCTFYLPHKNVDWTQWVGTFDNMENVESGVISKLQTLGYTYVQPNNLDVVQFSDNLSCKFYNIGDYTDYYSYTLGESGKDLGYTNYNNFSMIAEIVSYGNHFLFTGDVMPPAQNNNADHIESCDVYKIEHHALNILSSQKWLNKINPKFGVIFQYSNNYNDAFTANRPVVEHLSGKTVIFSTFDGDITITSKNGELYANGTVPSINIGDIEKMERSIYDTVNIYLDMYQGTEYETVSTYVNPLGKFVKKGNTVYFKMMLEVLKNISTGANSIVSNLPVPTDTDAVFYEHNEAGEKTAEYVSYGTNGWRVNGKHTMGDCRYVYGIYTTAT